MDPKTAQQPPSGGSSLPQALGDETASDKKQQVSYSGIGGKEAEMSGGLGSFEIPELSEIGKDIELLKDVENAGVKVTPTQVVIPQVLQQAGLLQVGQIQKSVSAKPQAVPLTDDQIAQGLTKSVKSSWRWMAEWCVRKLKQLHVSVKKAGGKLVRINN